MGLSVPAGADVAGNEDAREDDGHPDATDVAGTERAAGAARRSPHPLRR